LDNIGLFTPYAEYFLSTDDESEMERLLPGVKRLHSDRINIYRQRPPAARRARPDAARGDDPDTRSVINRPALDSHFNSGMQVKLQRRIRQGAIRPESSIDLHGYRQAEALQALQHFLDEALQRRCRMILVIHGQGFRSQSDAVLKPLVHRWLSEQPEVLAWCPAQPRDGAAGASYVYLRVG
jgi:DNA-nicking Smr family endonuclease